MRPRSRELQQRLANEMARQALEAAERAKAAEREQEDVAERLHAAADENGTLTVEAALGALGADDVNARIRARLAMGRDERHARLRERLLGEQEEDGS
jgi:hypothetical protein